jgi:hypothetical protein
MTPAQSSHSTVLRRRRRQPRGTGSARDESKGKVESSSERPERGEREKVLGPGPASNSTGERITMSTTNEPPSAGSVAGANDKQLTMIQRGDEIIDNVAKKTHLPFFAVLLIFLVLIAVIVVVFYCFLQKWWRRFRESDKGKQFKGLDLKSVNLIGQMGKEKVNDLIQFLNLKEKNEYIELVCLTNCVDCKCLQIRFNRKPMD